MVLGNVPSPMGQIAVHVPQLMQAFALNLSDSLIDLANSGLTVGMIYSSRWSWGFSVY